MIWWRRRPYHARADNPLWHILDQTAGHHRESRVLPALCGYRYDNIFSDARFYRGKTQPRIERCSKCERKAPR